jgi:hypothetical protein
VNLKWIVSLLFGQLDQPFFFDLQEPLGLLPELLVKLLLERQLLFLVAHLFLALPQLEEVHQIPLVKLGSELFDQ